MAKHTQTSKNSLPETLSVWLTAAVFLVNVFSAWQLMDSSETWRLTVISTPLPVTVFPYKVHLKLQERVHSAEHVKLPVTPISRVSGPLIITFLGPSARHEPQIQAKALADTQKSPSVFLSGIISYFNRWYLLTRHHHYGLSCSVFLCRRVKCCTGEGVLVWRHL